MNTRVILILFSLLLYSAVHAEDTPIVRVVVEPGVVQVGETVNVQIMVLSPTWFPKPPAFPSFELPNLITRLPPDSSYPISERVNGKTWSGIVRNYQMFPLLGATFILAGEVIGVTYADLETSRPVRATVVVPTIEFSAVVPPGAASLNPYIAGKNFTLTREIEGDPAKLEVGDALILRYIAELEGMPAIFLPPITKQLEQRLKNADGVSVYPNEPKIEEEQTATRTEVITLVFEKGGNFVVPELWFDWWNSSSRAVERVSVPELRLSVRGPSPSSTITEPALTAIPWRLLFGIGMALLAGTVLWRSGAGLRAWLARQRAERRLSESYAYKFLIKEITNKDINQTHQWLSVWVNRLSPDVDVYQFVSLYGDDGLAKQIERLGREIYGEDSALVDWRVLESGIGASRSEFRRNTAVKPIVLPPLNP